MSRMQMLYLKKQCWIKVPHKGKGGAPSHEEDTHVGHDDCSVFPALGVCVSKFWSFAGQFWPFWGCDGFWRHICFFLPGRGFSGEQILFWGMLLKICNIPIFAAIFITSVLLFVMIIPLLPFLFLFDIFLLFTTSMYGISGILQCGRENSLPPKARGVNLILQWIFCADLFSTIYCYLKAKNQR